MSNQQSVPTGPQVSIQVDFKAAFETLWNEIGPRTKELVTFHLGQLLKFTDSGRYGELAWIELCFSPDRCHPESVAQATNVALFLAILRDGPIEVLRAIKAFADKASNDSGEDRTGSDLSREKTVPSGLGGSDSNITMGGSDESTSDASMQDASILLPNQLAPKTRVSGRINRPDY
ncbi:hypothetical protein MHU86_1644 [Fragilaria crotonensis]|nr:hypothetical protein MHU86_1644 [Fragilaria crotonensis]